MSRWLCIGLFVISAATLSGASRAEDAKPVEEPAGKWQDVSLEDYRQHISQLIALTQACAKGRDVTTCDPLLEGVDDRVPLRGDRRLIRYGWLRVLFSRAEEKDEAAQAPGAKEKDVVTTSQLLKDAESRLEDDLDQADDEAEGLPTHDNEHATLQKVLAEREFRNLKRADKKSGWEEKLNQWLNNLFNGIGKLQTRSAWVGRLLVWGFVALVGVGLTWMLIRMERRWRIRLVPESDRPAPGAASARDWQLWLTDARKAAAEGAWGEAIHFLYWAAISRLESKRLWPADRARTPREYLALVAPDDPRKTSLCALTGSFERTWYGGRPASESDYQQTEAIAIALIDGNAAGGGQG